MRTATGFLLSLAAAAALAAPAGAATPFTIGERGGHPHLAVAPNGTMHAAWTEDFGFTTPWVTHYCKVARGSTSCTGAEAFTVPSGNAYSYDIGGPSVFLRSGGRTVRVLAFRTGLFSTPLGDSSTGLFTFTSTDSGASFGAPALIGTRDPSGDAAYGPGARVSVVSILPASGIRFQAAPLGGFAGDSALLSASGSILGTVAFAGGTAPIVAFADSTSVYFRLWSTGPFNAAAGWGPATLVDSGSEPRLAGGPAGVFLLYKTGAAASQRIVVRRFEGGAFGPAVTVSETGSPAFGDLFQDASGRLHAAWDGTGGPGFLGYASSADGVNWTRATLVSEERGPYFKLEVAAARDGRGFAVWDSNAANHGVVSAIPLEGTCARAVNGTRASDTIDGHGVGDTIWALAGADLVRGRGGDDCLYGGPGNDRLYGGPGADSLFGDAGNDTLDGADGTADRLDCGPGASDEAVADDEDEVTGCERVTRR